MSRTGTVFRVVSHGFSPPTFDTGRLVDWIANATGVPFVLGGHPALVTLRISTSVARTDFSLVSAGVGQKIVVTRLSVRMHNAVSNIVLVRIGFGASTTPTAAGVLLAHPALAGGGFAVEGDGSGIIGVGTDNEDVRLTSGLPLGGTFDIVIGYFLITI